MAPASWEGASSRVLNHLLRGSRHLSEQGREAPFRQFAEFQNLQGAFGHRASIEQTRRMSMERRAASLSLS